MASIKTITLGGTEREVIIAGQNCDIRSDGAEVIYASAKLELGSVATPFVPPVPATGLAKRQSYYQIRTTGGIEPMDLRPGMRINPTVTQLDNGNYAYSAEL